MMKNSAFSKADQSLEILMKLYDVYNDYSVGDPIIIKFSYGSLVENDDIERARDFVVKMRGQIISDVAEIEQRNSTVIIKPKI